LHRLFAARWCVVRGVPPRCLLAVGAGQGRQQARDRIVPCLSSSGDRRITYWVAVGNALAGVPPRGSVLAELPHTALTSGVWRKSVRPDTDAGSWGEVSSDRRAA